MIMHTSATTQGIPASVQPGLEPSVNPTWPLLFLLCPPSGLAILLLNIASLCVENELLSFCCNISLNLLVNHGSYSLHFHSAQEHASVYWDHLWFCHVLLS